MRSLILLLAVLCSAGAVAAPLPQLAFEQGNTVLSNPADDAIILRSAALDRVRLQLFRLPDDAAENQVITARLTQNITENGLLVRATEGRTPQWQADFVLPADIEATTQPIPLIAATGTLTPGDYVLVAQGSDVRVAQWFSITPVVLAHTQMPDGQAQSLVVDTATMAALPGAVVLALNAKGEVIGGAKADESGIARWAVPVDTMALRGEREGEGRPHAFVSLKTPPAAADKKTKGTPLTIEPDFGNDVAPAGATARFKLRLQGGANMLFTYGFAQEQMRYTWQHDANNVWKYKTVTTSTPVQRGSIAADDKGEADLALPVGEGRFRLTVSAGGARSTLVFTAGWWRSYPPAAVVCDVKDNNVVACAERH